MDKKPKNGQQTSNLLPWKVNKIESLFTCPIFEVMRYRAQSGDGHKQHNFFILENPKWINILPITPNNEVILIRQFRLGLGDFSLEIPGGLVEAYEDSQMAAMRELLEETGYGDGQVSLLGHVQPNPATHSNWCSSYVMFNAQKLAPQSLDQNEEIEIVPTKLQAIPKLITEGAIVHSLVLSAFFHYQMQQSALGNEQPWIHPRLPG